MESDQDKADRISILERGGVVVLGACGLLLVCGYVSFFSFSPRVDGGMRWDGMGWDGKWVGMGWVMGWWDGGMHGRWAILRVRKKWMNGSRRPIQVRCVGWAVCWREMVTAGVDCIVTNVVDR